VVISATRGGVDEAADGTRHGNGRGKDGGSKIDRQRALHRSMLGVADGGRPASARETRSRPTGHALARSPLVKQ